MRRIEKFVEALHPVYDISYKYQAKKPDFQAIMHVIKHSPYSIGQTALLGDRMRTDMVAANGAGVKA